MFKDISPYEADWYLSGDGDKRGADWLQPSQWFESTITVSILGFWAECPIDFIMPLQVECIAKESRSLGVFRDVFIPGPFHFTLRKPRTGHRVFWCQINSRRSGGSLNMGFYNVLKNGSRRPQSICQLGEWVSLGWVQTVKKGLIQTGAGG